MYLKRELNWYGGLLHPRRLCPVSLQLQHLSIICWRFNLPLHWIVVCLPHCFVYFVGGLFIFNPRLIVGLSSFVTLVINGGKSLSIPALRQSWQPLIGYMRCA